MQCEILSSIIISWDHHRIEMWPVADPPTPSPFGAQLQSERQPSRSNIQSEGLWWPLRLGVGKILTAIKGSGLRAEPALGILRSHPFMLAQTRQEKDLPRRLEVRTTSFDRKLLKKVSVCLSAGP